MCRKNHPSTVRAGPPSSRPAAAAASSASAMTQKESTWSLPRIPPLLVIALIPLLPTWCYINRGFTQWFHWVAVLYLLSRWPFLERFQVITGISICLGWYSALGYAAVYYGQFCLILYQNMPSSIKDSIFHKETGQIQYGSTSAQSMIALSHVLDLIGHPLLTYYFWRRHKQTGGTAADIFMSWPVIVSSYLYSRLWGMTHLLYNFGRPGIFYIGYDIYIMQHLDCWIPAYVAESVFYALVVCYKLFGGSSSDGKLVKATRPSKYDSTPKLAYSESGVSRSSSTESLALVGKGESSFLGTDWSKM